MLRLAAAAVLGTILGIIPIVGATRAECTWPHNNQVNPAHRTPGVELQHASAPAGLSAVRVIIVL